MPDTIWGDFWTPPVEDDVPVPKDVEFDHDAGRYRHVVDSSARDAWAQHELADIREWLRTAHE